MRACSLLAAIVSGCRHAENTWVIYVSVGLKLWFRTRLPTTLLLSGSSTARTRNARLVNINPSLFFAREGSTGQCVTLFLWPVAGLSTQQFVVPGSAHGVDGLIPPGRSEPVDSALLDSWKHGFVVSSHGTSSAFLLYIVQVLSLAPVVSRSSSVQSFTDVVVDAECTLHVFLPVQKDPSSSSP